MSSTGSTYSSPFPPASVPADAGQGVSRRNLILAAVAGLIVLALVVWAARAMFTNPVATQTIRDIFIVFLGVMALVIGVALVALIAQLAILTNVLRHEIRPILISTQQTAHQIQDAAHTIRGTTTFLSDNLVSPVIKAQGVAAGVRASWRLFTDMFRNSINGGK